MFIAKFYKSLWNIAPMEKVLLFQWSIFSWFVALMEKAWFYKRLFFEKVTVVVKDKKVQYKRYTILVQGFIQAVLLMSVFELRLSF